jgi:uncharacterized repeat protein (TIGR03803 family)
MRCTISRFVLCTAICISVAGGAFTKCKAAQFNLLHGFAGAPADGAKPQFGSLATDGTALYGFTANGGSADKGVLYKINPDGSGYSIVHSFTGLSFENAVLSETANADDGAYPSGTPLVISSTIYGMTENGGTNGTGCIFKIKTDGTGLQVLHSFGGGYGPWSDGYLPYGGLVSDGTRLYGMTYSSVLGRGTVFAIGINGIGFVTLYSFDASAYQAAYPQGSLALSGSTLYGMTSAGGTNGLGIIFEIQVNSLGYQVLHTFTGASNDGASPYGSLILSNSTLYGMTSAGGTNNLGTVFSLQSDGSGFQVLHSFAGPASEPIGDLVLSNATLYGMTGGTNNSGPGAVFHLNTDGSGFQIDYAFAFGSTNVTDGSTPLGSLLLLHSTLYGMTQLGGSGKNLGALFSLGDTNSAGGGGGGGTGGDTGTGALKVNLLPSTALKAGAAWQVDGGSFHASGTTVAGLSVGAHTVTFKTIAGWSTPAAQEVDVADGVTSTAGGTYVPADVTKPTLKVTAPTPNLRVNNDVFTASGTAADNAGVAQVNYQLNGGAWTAATTANNW